MFRKLKEDIDVILEQDPAARSHFEVILTYSDSMRFGHIESHMHFIKGNFTSLLVLFHK